ncbi:hypothetical protein BN381_250024 [Candidatus Microthrix parvicella RN1]|uniref:Uncharacterized protein n=1 Tax=Candidatus Neomicrothrix parvicella RN1 TaxID=1229780 RepID=R4Z2L6_9ACTN|nr:hypothetical protein BN381_250024 [Candidatus Microthrix parvicella RN1]
MGRGPQPRRHSHVGIRARPRRTATRSIRSRPTRNQAQLWCELRHSLRDPNAPRAAHTDDLKTLATRI